MSNIPTNRKRIFITGATGFIGSHVAAYFTNKNHDVACLVRESSNTDYLKELGVTIINGSLNDKEFLKECTKSIDCVIHIAAKAEDWGEFAEFHRVNVVAGLILLEVCKINNVPKVIFTGSVSSYGEENSIEIKNETSPYNSHYTYFLDRLFPCKMNYYRDTKAEGTKRALEYAKDKNINLIILEPVWVFGPREFSSGFYEYMKIVKSGLPVFMGSAKNKFHVIYVKDLVRAYYSAFESDISGVARFIIGNKEASLMQETYREICKNINKPKPKNLPKALFYPIGFLLELVYTLLRIKRPPLLTRGRVNMFYDSIAYNSKKAEEILQFRCKYSLEEGIKETVKWYKTQNLL